MLGGGGGTMMSPVTAVGSPYPSATMGRTTTLGRSSTSASNFKPSGKSVDCAVIMLDGLQQMFSIDVSLLIRPHTFTGRALCSYFYTHLSSKA